MLNKILTAKTLLTLTAALALSGPAVAQDTFRLGALIPLSGAGAYEAYKLAVDDVNAQGGILGRQVELVVADTTTNLTHAVAEARRLVEVEKVDALIGPITSQEVTPVLEVGDGGEPFAHLHCGLDGDHAGTRSVAFLDLGDDAQPGAAGGGICPQHAGHHAIRYHLRQRGHVQRPERKT